MLSGFYSDHLGSPGIKQALALKNLLNQRRQEVKDSDQLIVELEARAKDLKRNAQVQQSEIRRVLGYVAENELVFSFVQAPSSKK